MRETINGPNIICSLTIPYTICGFFIYKKIFCVSDSKAIPLSLFTTYVSVTALAACVFLIHPSKTKNIKPLKN